jgi:hypothetical protein
MKSIAARDHERASGAGSVTLRPVVRHDANANVEPEPVGYEPTPNPLWAITVGMGVFLVVVAALVAAGW